MNYLYEKNGKQKTLTFPLGKAPKSYKGYKKVLTVPHFHFKGGQGFTRSSFDKAKEGAIQELEKE